uniref:Mucin 1 n=1 Tax=Rhipicephalus microplus TaxID=6941 RepID=A0A034WWG1_RHIMP
MSGGKAVCVLFSMLLVAAMSQSSENETAETSQSSESPVKTSAGTAGSTTASQQSVDQTTGTSQSPESPDQTTCVTNGSNNVTKVLQEFEKFVAVSTTKSTQRNDSCGVVTKTGEIQCNPTTGAITGSYYFYFTYRSIPLNGSANITAHAEKNNIEIRIKNPLPMTLQYRLLENTGDCFILEGISNKLLAAPGRETYKIAFAKPHLPEDKRNECAMKLGQNATVFDNCKENETSKANR